jgi:hypothetical protein
MTRLFRLVAPALLLFSAANSCMADNFSFIGTFAYDTDVEIFHFTLANPTAGVALRTWSYAGGVDADGNTIPAGGFQPILDVYMADGTQMNPGVAGPCTVPTTGNALSDLLPDPATGECSDVYYPTTLSFSGGLWAPGDYIVALTEDANQGVGSLSDGFFASAVLGLPVPSNFTCQVGPTGFQGTPPSLPVDGAFCDEFSPGAQRNGNWALDILNVDSAIDVTAPEPNTLLFTLLGVAVLIAGLRLRG